MHIVDTLKFAIGIACLVIGLGILVYVRGSRGFNQSRQTAALLLIGGAIFVAIGFGFDVKGMFR